MDVILFIVIGIVLGLEHAFETDHVITVTMLTTQTKSIRRAVLLAGIWGLGHAVTLFIVSLVVLALRITIPDALAHVFELMVGLLLIGLAINGIQKILRGEIHSHQHTHDGLTHTHVHNHVHTDEHVDTGTRQSLFAGMVHGLAGSTALIVLVLSSFNSFALGMTFIVCFGFGAIIGMCLITLLIMMPVNLTRNSLPINRLVQLAAGALGLTMGLYIVVTNVSSMRG